MDKTFDVIIPSATLVPDELRTMGKLPGIIYPINQKIVFDYLYEQYSGIPGTIDVICYQSKEKVHRRLSNYKDTKIKIKDLDVLDDLGHTLYFAMKEKTVPAVVNFADTIVLDENLIDSNKDTVFYSEDYPSDVWTFFEINDGMITSIDDKIEIYREEKKKFFVGVFVILDCAFFCKCLEQAFAVKNRSMSTFYYALCRYSEKYPFAAQKADQWFDIGHAETYYNTKLEVKAREFNHITVDKNRGILKKTSDDKDKFIGEILWYLKLPADIEYVRPRIFGYSVSYNNPYISMEYYAYHTIHELFLYGDLNYHQWNAVFDKIRFVCSDFRRYSVKDDGIQQALKDMYYTKTLKRMEMLKTDVRFHSFFEKPIQINGVRYRCLNDIAESLGKVIPEMLFDVDEFHIIHGDLCFANVMVDSNNSFIKVIDPRGKFGKYDIYGDTRYELAKLLHSVDGKYDFIIKNLFTLEYDEENAMISYGILDRKREFDLYKLFLKVFFDEIGENLKKIELIESLLFLSMIPLHGESIQHQMVMLATGIEILDRVIDIREQTKNV